MQMQLLQRIARKIGSALPGAGLDCNSIQPRTRRRPQVVGYTTPRGSNADSRNWRAHLSVRL